MSTAGFTKQVWNNSIDNCLRLIRTLNVDIPDIKVSEYAEKTRILPSNTPFPGAWKNNRSPYAVEIMDNMSIYSPVQHTIYVKAAQIAATASMENVIAYWMDVCPADVMYISATQDNLTRWTTKRLEPLIDSCGLREKIFAQSDRRANKSTGDRAFSKEFIGGSLTMASAGSPASLRSDSIRILCRDEIDGARRLLTTGEGDWTDVSFARTFAYGNRKKVFDASTPTTIESSTIWKMYESGDQRRFFVPCPHCGTMQTLEFGHGFGFDNPNHGMQWEIKDGKLKKSWYVCPHCEKEIYNHHKLDFLPKGEWRPTSTSESEFKRSYQLSGLYSPTGMVSFDDLISAYLKAQNSDAQKMRSFVNLYLGLPYRETGSRPDWSKAIELRGDYHAGTVPDGVIFLTASVDVQRGSEKIDPNTVKCERLTKTQYHEKYGEERTSRPPRLEFDVCGHGLGYRTWDIEHVIFVGPIDDPNQGAWAELADYWRETLMTYRRHNGESFQLKMVFVDSGDGPHTPCVYAFARAWTGVLPSKGMSTVKRHVDEMTSEDVNKSILPYRQRRLDAGDVLIEINGPHYKTKVYTDLKIPRKWDGTPQSANFCDFPVEYGESYFRQLTAEEMILNADGTVGFQKSSARPNEALDLRVYNLAARDYYLEQMVIWLQAESIRLGSTPAQAKMSINSRTALEWLAQAASVVSRT